MVHDSNPGDIYADKDGRLWRVISYCAEPTVYMEAVEPDPPMDPNYAQQLQQIQSQPRTIELYRQKQRGGVNGLMWEGFKRIYRPE